MAEATHLVLTGIEEEAKNKQKDTFNPSTREAKAGGSLTCLVYRESARATMATQRNSAMDKKR